MSPDQGSFPGRVPEGYESLDAARASFERWWELRELEAGWEPSRANTLDSLLAWVEDKSARERREQAIRERREALRAQEEERVARQTRGALTGRGLGPDPVGRRDEEAMRSPAVDAATEEALKDTLLREYHEEYTQAWLLAVRRFGPDAIPAEHLPGSFEAWLARRSLSSGAMTPWQPGLKLTQTGWGGVSTRDRRHVTIAASRYESHIGGDRHEEISADSTLECKANLSVSIGPISGDPTATGRDELHVDGDMHWHCHDKMTLAPSGCAIDRTWYGGTQRIIGMEGVIVGGALSKAFVGTSMTMAGVASGDIYGGAIRASAARVHIAGFSYRSSELTGWKSGVYLRSTANTIEPMVSSVAPGKPKMSRRDKVALVARIGLATCPAFEILAGVLSIPLGIAMAIKNKVKKPPAPGTMPRTLVRTCTVIQCCRASETTV